MATLKQVLDAIAELRKDIAGLRKEELFDQRLAYTVKEAAQLCGTSKEEIYIAAARGEITVKPVGDGTMKNRFVIPRAELERWLVSGVLREEQKNRQWGAAHAEKAHPRTKPNRLRF